MVIRRRIKARESIALTNKRGIIWSLQRMERIKRIGTLRRYTKFSMYIIYKTIINVQRIVYL